MQFVALLTKEIKLLLKNWQLLLVSILVPILTVIVSYVTSQTSTIDVYIGYMEAQFNETQIQMIQNSIIDTESVELIFIKYQDMNDIENDYYESSIDSYILMENDNIQLFYDSTSTKGELASAYLYQAIQIINSNELYLEHSDIIDALEQARIYNFEINDMTVERNEKKIDPLINFGFIWIFLYSTINNAITQMQQEKSTRTILYLIKAPINPIKIFFTKQIAILFQFFIMISSYIIFVWLMGMYSPQVGMEQILIWTVIVLSVSSIGHLISLLINNNGVMLIAELILVFPIMLVDTLQTTLLDNVIEIVPTYKAANLMVASLEGTRYSLGDVLFLLMIVFVCCSICCFIMKKRDAIKLCDTE